MAIDDRVRETQDLNHVFSQFALKITNFSLFRRTFQICILLVEASILLCFMEESKWIKTNLLLVNIYQFFVLHTFSVHIKYKAIYY